MLRPMQGLEVEALFSSPLLVGQGGVRALSFRGDALYDVGALKDELLKR